jgi:hypothetical protein
LPQTPRRPTFPNTPCAHFAPPLPNPTAAQRLGSTSRYSLFISARNLTNAAYINMQDRTGSPPLWSAYQVWGTTWTFGAKGVF